MREHENELENVPSERREKRDNLERMPETAIAGKEVTSAEVTILCTLPLGHDVNLRLGCLRWRYNGLIEDRLQCAV